MRLALGTIIWYLVLVSFVFGKPRVNVHNRHPKSIRIIRNLEAVQNKTDANNTKYSNKHLSDQELLNTKKYLIDHPDRPAILTDEIIWSQDTEFTTYQEDDEDLHLVIRIPNGRGSAGNGRISTVGGSTSNFSTEENETNLDYEVLIDEEGVEVVSPKIDVVLVVEGEVENSEEGNELDESNTETPPLQPVVDLGSDDPIEETTTQQYQDPDSNNEDSIIIPSNTDYEDPEGPPKTIIVVDDKNNQSKRTNEKVDEKQQNDEVKENQNNNDDEEVLVIINTDYEDPEYIKDQQEETNKKIVNSSSADNKTKKTVTVTETETKTETAKPQQQEESITLPSSISSQLKTIEDGGLSLFWICAILFCCFV